MPSLIVERAFQQPQQRPSLLVVLGNGPTYNAGTDVPRGGRHAQFFATQDVFTTRVAWQVSPTGPPGQFPSALQANFARFFSDYQTFAPQWAPSPRTTTDFWHPNADVYSGFDTHGWPPDPWPPYWSPPQPITSNVLENFTPYNYAHDVVWMRPFARHFGEYQTQFGPQPLTQNVLITFTPYVEANDPIFRRPFSQIFGAYIEQPQRQPLTINALVYFPPPAAGFRVRAVSRGAYNEIWRDPGDVFDLLFAQDFSDSSKSVVPVGNPLYPLPGWMVQVPQSTPLYSYALANYGFSSIVVATYQSGTGGPPGIWGISDNNRTVW